MIENIPLPSESTAPKQRIKAHWKHVTDDLEMFFRNTPLPDKVVRLSRGETIEDVSSMVQQHLEAIRSQHGTRDFLAHVQRLQKLKAHLINNHYKISHYEKQSA